MFPIGVQEEVAWMTVGREMKNFPSPSVLPEKQLIGFQKQNQLMQIHQKGLVHDIPFKIRLMLPCFNHNVRSNKNTLYKMFKNLRC